MIHLKSAREIVAMRRAGEITGQALLAASRFVQPGVSTKQVENVVKKVIRRAGAESACLGYRGFPGWCCVSVNNEVIHGIPSKLVLREGDIVSLDVSTLWDGYFGDAAATFPVGEVSDAAQKLIRVTRECFYQGLSFAREGGRVSDMSHAVQTHAEKNGFAVVRAFTGHGVGAQLHEAPDIPNFGIPGRGPRMLRGMTFALEPMVCAGSGDVRIEQDGWTVVTMDGNLSAHYEHTILITSDACDLLTAWEESA